MKALAVKLFIAVFLILILVGCGEDRYFLVPQKGSAPTFPTKDFSYSNPYEIELWPEYDVNGTYLVGEEKPVLGFIKDTKIVRGNYNILLTRIIKFNKEVDVWNEEQNSKTPIEVEENYIGNF